MLKSELQLKRLCNKFNLKYFNGTLPPFVIYYSPVDGAYANCDQLEDGTLVIKISPSIGGWNDFVKLTCLHELVHLKLWPDRSHGAKFDKEILRLMTTYKELRKLI